MTKTREIDMRSASMLKVRLRQGDAGMEDGRKRQGIER